MPTASDFVTALVQAFRYDDWLAIDTNILQLAKSGLLINQTKRKLSSTEERDLQSLTEALNSDQLIATSGHEFPSPFGPDSASAKIVAETITKIWSGWKSG